MNHLAVQSKQNLRGILVIIFLLLSVIGCSFSDFQPPPPTNTPTLTNTLTSSPVPSKTPTITLTPTKSGLVPATSKPTLRPSWTPLPSKTSPAYLDSITNFVTYGDFSSGCLAGRRLQFDRSLRPLDEKERG